MATRADQLLETARLGSDKLEYLTQDLRVSNSDLCTIAGGHPDDLLRRRMLALELDPYEMTLSDPALLRHLQRCCALCESREDCAWIWRAHRRVEPGKVGTIGATIARTP